MVHKELAAILAQLSKCDGFSESTVPGVRLACSHRSHLRAPLLYQPSLTLVAQGQKTGYLGERVIHYGAGHYLLQTLPLPFECETDASLAQPLLAMQVVIDPAMLAELTQAIGTVPPEQVPLLPMAALPMNDSMAQAALRLAEALADPLTARVMGQSRVKELLYEALRGPQGRALWELAEGQGHYSQIVQVLGQLQQDLTAPLRVESLAKSAGMSLSSFHYHFKSITGSSPLQYQKKLRLLQAQLLLSHDDNNVTQAAMAVGYQSVHHFSRDYKRYFGWAPGADKKSRLAAVG
ncbi:AraC family transcriptional regulator N-terminal domain-containing protein [Gallaecimonas sp. GXIMD1310]|uniref:AraC family transcriptional regulator n=1 Tax=Gallaecimonas sp. GXIMD1310 TaxID=3131926 RepID=UPI00324E80F5